jgi:3-deoxy-D-manno-octulosonate 8-phosphate phosphatase (KDO 8-P phosphatase)
MENFKQKLRNISCFVFDLDGVLTDGTILIMNDEQYRNMNMKDGYALKEATNAGYKVFVISGGRAISAEKRLNYLKVTEFLFSVEDKKKALQKLMKKHKLKRENVLYMGDDIPDVAPMKLCGVITCPADAVSEIKNISIYVSDKKGGDGCARDVIEQVMRLHGKWFKPDNK